MAWAKMKYFIREHNTTGDMSLTRLKKLTEEAIQVVSASDWEGFIKKVVEKEQFYWNRDIVVEEAIDSIIINMGNEHSDSDSELESTDNESDDGDGDQESEVLAVPLDD